MVRNSVLLTLKGVDSQRFKNGLYNFETPTMRGFLEGNIALDSGVVIQAFDHQDRLLTLTVGAKPAKLASASRKATTSSFRFDSLRPASNIVSMNEILILGT